MKYSDRKRDGHGKLLPVDIPIEYIIEQYTTTNKTAKDIGEEFGVGPNTILKKLKANNIVLKKRFHSLLGQTFERLTVIDRIAKEKNGKNYYFWVCKCICGNVVNVKGNCLLSGVTKSCGCIMEERKLGSYEGLSIVRFNKIKFSSTQRAGRNRDIEFDITIEYVWELFLKQNGKCALSNRTIKLPRTSKECRILELNTASLDRIDSSKGYIEGNVQWVHRDINWMKQDFDQKYFIDFCKDIAKNHSSKPHKLYVPRTKRNRVGR